MGSDAAQSWDHEYSSGNYRHRWDRSTAAPDLVGAVVSLSLPDRAHVLDIGCGSGSDAIFLASCGYKAIGVDLSSAALSIAADKATSAGVSVDWRVGSALELPVESGTISLAADRGCFHHIQHADRPQYASEVLRVLKPDGYLLLRGSRQDFDIFVAITEDAVDQVFDRQYFTRGPILPFNDGLESNIVLLKKW